jgi:tetratricopeptide (TPR) repeat protein
MSNATLSPPDFLETARTHHAQNRLLEAANAYRQTLESDPQSQAALLGLSLIARQSNQLQPALRMAQAALAAGPQNALAWANYGDLLLAARDLPNAQSAYRRALAIDPAVAPARYGLGNTYALQEDYPTAYPHFEAAAKLNPAIPEFHFAQAFAHGKLGDHAKAIAAYRRAVQLRPNFASAWLNLGVELIADGRDSLAELCYTQALASAANPDTQISTHLNHGHLHRGRKHFPAAQSHYQSAFNLAQTKSPARQSEVHVAFTYLHLEQNQFEAAHQALQCAESAQRTQHPAQPNPEIPNVRGILLLAEQATRVPPVSPLRPGSWVPPVSPLRPGSDASPGDLLHQAIQAFHQAELQGHKTAPSNRGNALLRLGRVEDALQAHQTALQLDPRHPGVRYNLALTQLRAGNFTEGWQNYEIRWQFREVHPHPRRFSQPLWQGQPLQTSDALFLYAEQGLGDTIQFLRYLPDVLTRLRGTARGVGASPPALDLCDSPNPRVILEVQPPLTRLIAHSLSQWPCACRPERGEGPAPRPAIQVISQGDPIPPCTHHIPLMSLPALFQTTIETIPTQIPYLFSPSSQTNAGAPPLTPQLGRGREQQIPGCERQIPSIGIHWAGNLNYRADRERSTRLPTFLPLLKLPGMQWISLQKGPAVQQIAEIPPELRPIDACSQDRDLADTAAQIAPLDLVLTTDSAVAHLAAAMGKPLWLLLPWQSDWRWMQDRLRTPWYPQARLFRQSSPHNWPELISRIATELHSLQSTGHAIQ